MLNWIARYAPAAALLLDGRGRLTGSLLDAGSGPVGFACVGGEAPFIGLDIAFARPPAPPMRAVRVSPGPLPLADAAVDTVLSLDALEHLPAAERPGFVAELARVAARRVLIACPSSEAAWVDDLMRRTFAGRGEAAPDWLDEHAEHGLPAPAEIEAACRVPGFRARPLPQPPGLLAILAALADTMPELAPLAAAEARERPSGWARIFAAAAGPSFRAGYVLEREEPLPARVSAACRWDEVLAALRCPACGAPLAPAGGGAACREGHGFEGGAPGRPLELPAPALLWCRPSWRPEGLAALVRRAVERGAALALHAHPADVDPARAESLARAALEGVPAGLEVTLLTGPLDDEGRRLRARATVVAEPAS